MGIKIFVDTAFGSINKYGEELCGDKVEIVKTNEAVIVVISDGLGSGVKANILAGLTSKIAVTMLKEGAALYETVDTIMQTLPVCKVRELAYSTFTIIKIHYDGRVYIAEYDNPPFFLVAENKKTEIYQKEISINGKKVKESAFDLDWGDGLVIVSDGVVHAGAGNVLNLGWQWENVMEYLKTLIPSQKCARDISKELLAVCSELYQGKPGDDATVVAIKARYPEVVTLFSGPPEDRRKDRHVIEKLMKSCGKKVVCGGTAGNIASRELNEELVVEMDYLDSEVPPTAKVRGIDLVTEGVLTLSKTLEKLKKYHKHEEYENDSSLINGKDGASRLAALLIMDCTHLNMLVGKAVNPAHQNPSFPTELCIKLNILEDIASTMRQLGKEVNIEYV